MDLFAGISVSDYPAAVAWYARLFGGPPAFEPNDVESVWKAGEHAYVYVQHRPDHAGHALTTLFVTDLDARLAAIESRGLSPTAVEVYAAGSRKATFTDHDGNEIGFAGPI
ncbi:hypothetical protein Aco03nite_006480 [Actinoplanes couchii]|uniref:VOC domain-containing protein n=1 Tax=Actinoplanes couchii TaxID=403638 RepID=A0ABQ3X1B9_9ACTN|nr:hypothetical protein Aco03nite_006480 [Actinoplanes couchii]